MLNKFLTFMFFSLFSFITSSALAQTVVTTSEQQITIQGKNFYKDGKPWIPKGVDVNAFVKPPKFFHEKAQIIRSSWGATELKFVKEKFGVDTLRFHVSQGGLDPQANIYDPIYLSQIMEPVQYARKLGFVVIIVMDAAQDGTPDLKCMPSPSSLRAWRTLAPSFMKDTGIMFELFNEPCKKSTAQEEWADKMQILIDTLRGLGSQHILLLDGLDWARVTNGLFPLIHDTLPNHIALAVHPYLEKETFENERQWHDQFGSSAEQYPLIVTEWNAVPTNGCIGKNTPAAALSLMRYLESLHIGLIEWGIDSDQGRIVKDHMNFEPTDYASFTDCKDESLSGGGQLLVNYPND